MHYIFWLYEVKIEINNQLKNNYSNKVPSFNHPALFIFMKNTSNEQEPCQN